MKLKRKGYLTFLCCMVVFVTTYLLILPAVTLDQEEAEKQGGIDVEIQTEQVEPTEQTEQSDQVEPTEQAELEETAPAEQVEMVREELQGSLSYTGKGYSVSADCDGAGLPAETELVSEEIGKKDKDYDALYEDALKAVQKESNDQTCKFAFAKFYDISLMVGGEVLEPDDPINVTISYDKALKASDADKVRIVHFAVDEKTGEVTPEVLKQKHVEASVEAGKLAETTFEAESFSVYGVVYTVDFEYSLNGQRYQFSLPGGKKVALSDLIEVLGITSDANSGEKAAFNSVDSFLKEVENVEFSDESLVKVTKNLIGDDWTLKSLAPFDTEESLTITMKNGDEIMIRVTDAQTQSSANLADFLTNASINAPVNSDGAYVITPDTSYNMSLTFGETKSLQFSEGALTYDFSQSGMNFSGLAQSGTFSLKVNDGGTFYDITGNQFSIDENGILTISFNSSDPNYSKLMAANNLKYTIDLDVKVNSDAHKITFTDEIEKDVVIDTSNSVSASKSATFNKSTGKVDYTVAVVSHGISENVVVKDTITGDVLTLDASSISATSSTGRTVPMNGSASGNSFEYTIPSMSNGEVITFTYSADVNLAMIQNNGGRFVTSGSNRVEVKSDGDPEPDIVNRTTTIDYTPTVSKSNGTITEDNGNKKTLSWTITANEDCKVSMAGGTITDTIASNSQSIMKYSGTGIAVQVYDANGILIRTDDPVLWGAMQSKTDSSWTYKIPDSDAGHAYKYVITYTTEVDVTGKTSATQVENTVQTDGGKSSTGHGNVPTPPGNEIKLEKSVDKIDMTNKEVTWDIAFNVPVEGLDTAVITELYPNQWANNVQVIDDYVDGSLSIAGLKSDEHYEVQHNINTGDEWNKRMGSVITFYKNATETGLQGGTARTITITLKTKINETWIEAARSTDWLKTHTNNVELLANTDKKTAQAPAIISAQNIQKSSEPAGTRVENGVEYPVYKYAVRLDNVTSDVNVITDTYNTDLLEPYAGDHAFYVGYGNEYVAYNGWYSSAPASYVETSTGMVITTADESIPKHEDGSYYPAYWLYYYLTVKDEAALKTIMGEAAKAENHKYTMSNTATWNDMDADADVTYEYRGVEKELLTSADQLKVTDEDIWADFRITLNPGALTLNGGDPITVTDAITNLSVDYDSIKVTPANGVTWDQSGSVTTFTIPDATKIVITYRARVIFTTIGENGETIKVDFSNKATMDTFEDTVGGTGERHNSGAGGASVPVINALKYRAGSMNQPLEGAEFALLDANYDPVIWGKDYESHKAGDPVRFVTGSDGKIQVRGNQKEFGWALNENEKYYLREIKAPEGYMLATHDWEFTISADGTTDYTGSSGSYIYHTGDTMSVRNYPGTDVKVNKVWSDGNDKHGDDRVTVKLQQKIGTADWSDTVYIDKNGSNSRESVWEGSEKTLELTSEKNWEGRFAGLPLVAPQDPEDPLSEDVDVSYRVLETSVNGNPPEEGTVNIKQSKDGGAFVVTITNTVQEPTGSLALEKLVRVNEFDPDSNDVANADKAKADGTYKFNIVGKTGTPTAGKLYEVLITMGHAEVEGVMHYGVPTGATVNGTSVPITDNKVTISDMVPGEYTVTESEHTGTLCIAVACSDHEAETDVDTMSATVTVPTDRENVDPKLVTFTNNFADDSDEDIAHLSVRKTFIGLPADQLPEDFKVTVKVNGTTYTLTGSATQPSGITFNETKSGDAVVWNWTIAIHGLTTEANVEVQETDYEKEGYTVKYSVNGQSNRDTYTGNVHSDTVVETLESHEHTAGNEKTFPLSDSDEIAKIFVARLTGQDKGALVISKKKLNISERKIVEAKLKAMEHAQNWTEGKPVRYFSFEEANQIFVRGTQVTYDDNAKTVTFVSKQWNMCATFTLGYQPGRPADFNFTNDYTATEVDLNVVKIAKDDSTMKLPGAKFKASLLDEERTTAGRVVIKTETVQGEDIPVFSREYGPTDDDGKVTLTGLTSGYYMIEETQTPSGYVKSETDPTFYIHVDGGEMTYLVRSTETADAGKKLNEWSTSETGSGLVTYNKNTTTATVENEPGAVLPSSGGPGTVWIYLLGSILLLGAGISLIARRRTRI